MPLRDTLTRRPPRHCPAPTPKLKPYLAEADNPLLSPLRLDTVGESLCRTLWTGGSVDESAFFVADS